jgi:hypothetical protein
MYVYELYVCVVHREKKSRQPIIDTQYTVHNKTCHYVTAGKVYIYPLQQFTEAKCAIYKNILKGGCPHGTRIFKGTVA